MRTHRRRIAQWTLLSSLAWAMQARAQAPSSSGSQAPAPAPKSSAFAPAPSAAPPAAPTPPAPAPTAPAPVVPTAPPSPPAPAPAAPAAPAAPTAAGTEPPIPTAVSVPPGHALVHVSSDYANATLELRNTVDLDAWTPACVAPCDRVLAVDGKQVRVTARGMTPSNAFLIEGGSGTAQFRVSGGSASARTLGLIGLGSGIPVLLGGGALYGYGKSRDNGGLTAAGMAVLILGALEVAVALPLLVAGSTSVHDGKGSKIARALTSGAEF